MYAQVEGREGAGGGGVGDVRPPNDACEDAEAGRAIPRRVVQRGDALRGAPVACGGVAGGVERKVEAGEEPVALVAATGHEVSPRARSLWPGSQARTIAFANASISRRAAGPDAGRRADTRRSCARAGDASPASPKQWLAARKGRRSPMRWNWGREAEGGRVGVRRCSAVLGTGRRGGAHLFRGPLRVSDVTERDGGRRNHCTVEEALWTEKGGGGVSQFGAAAAAG